MKLRSYGTFWVFIKRTEKTPTAVVTEEKKKADENYEHEPEVVNRPYKRKKGEDRISRLTADTSDLPLTQPHKEKKSRSR